MKSNVCLGKTYQISLCLGLLKFLGCHPEPSQLFLRDQLAGFLYGNILKGNTHLQNIVEIFLRDTCNLGSSSRDHHHQPFLFQLTHGFTDRSSAHTQPLRKGDLQKSFSGFQLALQDCLPQSVKNNIAKRQILIHIHRKITCHP